MLRVYPSGWAFRVYTFAHRYDMEFPIAPQWPNALAVAAVVVMRAFSYAWSLPVTWQSYHSIRHSQKPHAARKFHGSMFYRAGIIVNRSLRKYGFSTFIASWPWPWPDDLHIRSWPVFPGDTPHVQK